MVATAVELPLQQKKTDANAQQAGPVQFGNSLLKEFLHDPAYRNLNHGTYSLPSPFLLPSFPPLQPVH